MRKVTDCQSAATNLTERCGLIEPLRERPLRGYILTPYTSLIKTDRMLLLGLVRAHADVHIFFGFALIPSYVTQRG